MIVDRLITVQDMTDIRKYYFSYFARLAPATGRPLREYGLQQVGTTIEKEKSKFRLYFTYHGRKKMSTAAKSHIVRSSQW